MLENWIDRQYGEPYTLRGVSTVRRGVSPETCRSNAVRRWVLTLLKILIVVVIGAAILLILNAAVPNLFSGLIEKISGELTGVNVLP
jgi:hypothetical protein